jgi:hypothetical protein
VAGSPHLNYQSIIARANLADEVEDQAGGAKGNQRGERDALPAGDFFPWAEITPVDQEANTG